MSAPEEILIPVSPGELIDRLTILDLKLAHIGDPGKRANVAREHAALSRIATACIPNGPDISDLRDQLAEVNATLWKVEDDIRACDKNGDFGARFVQLAQSVYRLNDRRAALKRRINLILCSDLIEEKSYRASGQD